LAAIFIFFGHGSLLCSSSRICLRPASAYRISNATANEGKLIGTMFQPQEPSFRECGKETTRGINLFLVLDVVVALCDQPECHEMASAAKLWHSTSSLLEATYATVLKSCCSSRTKCRLYHLTMLVLRISQQMLRLGARVYVKVERILFEKPMLTS
jgi:hypothetical protein